jgi:protein-S-isoprenylcysteine O-methyltransferase Ste14
MPELDRPRLIAPPPLLFAICVVAALIVNHFRPLPLFTISDLPRYVVSALIFLIAIGLGSSSIREFRAHKEHPSPYKATNAIVDSGPFRFTRNPIYLSFLMITVAIAVLANSWWLVLALIPLALLLEFGVIRREEEYLSRKFGSVYDDYRHRVRRWI